MAPLLECHDRLWLGALGLTLTLASLSHLGCLGKLLTRVEMKACHAMFRDGRAGMRLGAMVADGRGGGLKLPKHLKHGQETNWRMDDDD